MEKYCSNCNYSVIWSIKGRKPISENNIWFDSVMREYVCEYHAKQINRKIQRWNLSKKDNDGFRLVEKII